MSETDTQPDATSIAELDTGYPGGGFPGRARLLVVDDQPINIRVLHEVFARDHDVFMATTGEKALEFCADTPPDLILLDVVLPGVDGLQVCRTLKNQPETAGIPVIFVTSLDDAQEEAACWDAGGVDFITKPINPQTVRNRVRAHLTLKYQVDVLRQMAWIDGLTGVANRRQFDQRLEKEWARCRREDRGLSVASIDIDHFKRFNDTYGHLEGDDCLRLVAKAISRAIARPGDLAARTGGEEFSCILPGTDADGARVVGKRILAEVADLKVPHSASRSGFVSVSVGIATARPNADRTISTLLHRADQALYAAKQAGRNKLSEAADREDSAPAG